MRGKSVLPIFVFVAIALYAVLGVIILGYSIMAGSESSTDTTAQATTEAWWETGSAWMFGLAALLCIFAIFLAIYLFFAK